MKKKLIILVLIAMAATFVYLRLAAIRSKRTLAYVGSTAIKIEIADTVGRQQRGLSFRPLLPAGEGMYFPMGWPLRYSFWMKEMQFPLDIIWIHEGIIVDISENVPYPQAGEEPAKVSPKEPADAVLEVNANFTETHGTKIGDRVRIES